MQLRHNRMEHQIPVNQFVDEGSGPLPGLSLWHNAFWVEPTGDAKLRFYFMTETNNQADLTHQATPDRATRRATTRSISRT